MTRVTTSALARAATRAALGLAALVLVSAEAGAVSPSVESACASDYLAYCSQHPTEGAGVRRCMRANGPKLSTSCINALIAAGEVSKKEVARRAANR